MTIGGKEANISVEIQGLQSPIAAPILKRVPGLRPGQDDGGAGSVLEIVRIVGSDERCGDPGGRCGLFDFNASRTLTVCVRKVGCAQGRDQGRWTTRIDRVSSIGAVFEWTDRLRRRLSAEEHAEENAQRLDVGETTSASRGQRATLHTMSLIQKLCSIS